MWPRCQHEIYGRVELAGTPGLAGCDEQGGDPQTGDLRLVPFPDTDTPTAACDEVHVGGVEIYNRGRWGAVCIGGGDTAQFTIDAQVVCRQLGFHSGVMYQIAESIRFPYDYGDYVFGPEDEVASDFAWASEVVCTGTEARLDECLFTEGSDNTLGGLPAEGLSNSCFRSLAVACTQFDLVGAAAAADPQAVVERLA